MEPQSVPKITICLWVLRVILIGLSAAMVCIFLKAFLLSGFIAVTAGIMAIYLPFFLKTYKISILSGILYISYGIIFRTTRLLPLNNAIYINSLKTPVLKALGLTALKIKTVKTILFLPELKSGDAVFIIKRIEGDFCEN